MHKYSQKAASYIVIAHYGGEEPTVRSFSLSSETPIREIFNSLWPESEILAGSRFAPIPLRIEILADEKTIPKIEEPGLFDEPKTVAA